MLRKSQNEKFGCLVMAHSRIKLNHFSQLNLEVFDLSQKTNVSFTGWTNALEYA